MGEACILNMNNRGEMLAAHLKTAGRIIKWEYAGNARIRLTFRGELTITFEDYLEVHPLAYKIRGFKAVERMERENFKREIQAEAIRTLRAAEVKEFVPGEKIVLADVEKTEIICIRVTPEEKRRVEEKAAQFGLTVSDYVRSIILNGGEENERGN